MRSRFLALAAVALLMGACGQAVPGTTPVVSVAVPTPTAVPTPPAAATPAPAATPSGEAHWTKVGRFAPPNVEAGMRFTVAGFDGGYVVSDLSAYAWFSPDGATWSGADLPASPGEVRSVGAIAGGGNAVLAVGAYSGCHDQEFETYFTGNCRSVPMSWITRDGRTWTASAPWLAPGSTDDAAGDPPVLHGDSALAAWAVPGGGWDAVTGSWTGSDTEEGAWVRPVLWHSDDGLAWAKTGTLPEAPSGSGGACPPSWLASPVEGAADATGRRVLWLTEACTREVVALGSADGRTYAALPGAPGGAVPSARAIPSEGDGPWLVLAGDPHGRSDAWTSRDLAGFEGVPTALPEGTALTRVDDAAATPDGWVLTGVAKGSDKKTARATWRSGDGVTWRLADVRAGGPAALDIAWGPAGVIGVEAIKDPEGQPAEDNDSAYRLRVWRLADAP